ncbi:MAG: molybdate ABC transporter permease subunit [Phycisphaerales bacterium]
MSASAWSAVALSLQVALASLAIGLVPGVALGWLLARRRFPGRTLVEAIIHLPLVLPPVVVGFGLLVLFGRQSAVGAFLENTFGLRIAFTWKAAAIASAVMGFPLLVRSVRLAMELVDARIERAAAPLGAPPWQVFLRVTLPLAAPGVVAGATLAFARSLGEFGATIMFAGNIEGMTRTLPLAIYTTAQQPGGDGATIRLALVATALALLATIASELLARRMQTRRES